MKTRHVIAIALTSLLTATGGAYAQRSDDFQAPRGQDLQAPRTYEDIQAPRGQEQQAPRG